MKRSSAATLLSGERTARYKLCVSLSATIGMRPLSFEVIEPSPLMNFFQSFKPPSPM
jgi:hypothetical protein